MIQAGLFFVVLFSCRSRFVLSAGSPVVRLLAACRYAAALRLGDPQSAPPLAAGVFNFGFMPCSRPRAADRPARRRAGPEIVHLPLLSSPGAGLGAMASQLGGPDCVGCAGIRRAARSGVLKHRLPARVVYRHRLAVAFLISVAPRYRCFLTASRKPSIPDRVGRKAHTSLASSLPFPLRQDLEAALRNPTSPPGQRTRVMETHEQRSRIVRLRSRALPPRSLALSALVATLHTRGIPTVNPRLTRPSRVGHRSRPVRQAAASTDPSLDVGRRKGGPPTMRDVGVQTDRPARIGTSARTCMLVRRVGVEYAPGPRP